MPNTIRRFVSLILIVSITTQTAIAAPDLWRTRLAIAPLPLSVRTNPAYTVQAVVPALANLRHADPFPGVLQLWSRFLEGYRNCEAAPGRAHVFRWGFTRMTHQT